jgi:hypothetical protein
MSDIAMPVGPELPPELMVTIIDALLDQNADAALASFAQTSRSLHAIITPLLYDTVRLTSSKSVRTFLDTMKIPSEPAINLAQAPTGHTERPDRRSLIRHVEISDHIINEETNMLDRGWSYLIAIDGNSAEREVPARFGPFPNIETCYLSTTSDDSEDRWGFATDAETLFICLATSISSLKHLRWQHRGTFIDPERNMRSLWRALSRWYRYDQTQNPRSRLQTIQLPLSWQCLYWHDLDQRPICYQVLVLSSQSLSGAWYTNPHKIEEEGSLYERQKRRKASDGEEYVKPTYHVSLAPTSNVPDWISLDTEDRDRWQDLIRWRTISGTLTDFAVMAKQDLINVKVVSLPEYLSPTEWREWLRGDAIVEGGDIQADIREILK